MSKRKNRKDSPSKSNDEGKPNVQGEGNIAADRRYRAGVANTLATKDVEELAKRARESVEAEEREAQQRARTSGNPRV